MPIFMCTKCGVVENTALSDFWISESTARLDKVEHKPKCSQCTPRCGRWHGAFPRKLATGYLQDQRGLLYTVAEAGSLIGYDGVLRPVVLPEGIAENAA